MSKAWGCAAIRLGMAFAQNDIVEVFNKVKYPYNINTLTQEQAKEVLKEPYTVEKWVKIILLERDQMIDAFKLLPSCRKVYPTDANFFLAKFDNAQAVYDYLVEQGVNPDQLTWKGVGSTQNIFPINGTNRVVIVK